MVGLVPHVQVRVQVAVALVDRGAVGVEELAPAHLLVLEQVQRLLGRQPERVDAHAGGTRK